MAITLTEKMWKANRPASAEGSGVAKALKLTDAHCKKAPAGMSLAEVGSALTAVEALSKALKLAQEKMKGDKSKEASKTSPLMPGWMAECTAFAYEVKARKVGIKFAEVFAESKARVDTEHADAQSAHQMMIGRGAPPIFTMAPTWARRCSQDPPVTCRSSCSATSRRKTPSSSPAFSSAAAAGVSNRPETSLLARASMSR